MPEEQPTPVELLKSTTYGPFLRFGGYVPAKHLWRISALVVTHLDKCTTPPTLKLKDGQGGSSQVTAVRLDDMDGWVFWRFDVAVECGPAERTVEYEVVMPQGCEPTMMRGPHRVTIPAADQPVRWGFYSCNGFHELESEQEAGGIQPLWRDVVAYNQQTPLHAIVGGGDQLYNDLVWSKKACPHLQAWTELPSDEQRVQAPFSPEMHAEVTTYYLEAYLRHWSQDVFSDALAVIPQIQVWDDHDIWDGWGSYPDYLQNCPVFQGAYAIARKAYGLFQQHTTAERAVADNGVFGHSGWHWVGCISSTTALVIADGRSERKQRQVMHPQSFSLMRDRVAALPDSVQHVIFVATVPVLYPKIPMMESALGCITCGLLCGRGRSTRFTPMELLAKSGLAKSLLSQFGTVDILDDLMDHWGAEVHMDERKELLHMMQGTALARGWRWSILSGDVHVAGVGQFESVRSRKPENDYRYMPQIISSAIGNVPPPDSVVKTLTRFARTRVVDFHTKEKMLDTVFGDKRILMDARNWLVVREQGAAEGGAITYQFRVETKTPGRIATYEFRVPRLEGVAPAARPGGNGAVDPGDINVTLPLQPGVAAAPAGAAPGTAAEAPAAAPAAAAPTVAPTSAAAGAPAMAAVSAH